MEEHALSTLGILDDVKLMFENVGWCQFVDMKYPTYEEITLEFLSSLNSNILHGEDCGSGLITFRLFSQEYKINLPQFNEIFGLPCGGERRMHDEFKEKNLLVCVNKGF